METPPIDSRRRGDQRQARGALAVPFHDVIALPLQSLAIEDRVRIEYAAELDETASWTEKMIAGGSSPSGLFWRLRPR